MPTKIEWARNADGSQGETWNPLRAKSLDGKPNISKSGHFGTGCTMVSPGCQHCYAGTINKRFYGNDYSYHSKPAEFFLDQKIMEIPLRRKKPTTWFVGSMLDVFHGAIPYDLIWRMFITMRACPGHTFQVLTKRPENMRAALKKWGHWRMPFENVWLGVSAEDQEYWDKRVPILMSIPAVVHFVSVEPLIGPITDITKITTAELGLPEWVIIGGESGAKCRAMEMWWATSLVQDLQSFSTPRVFVKQLGGHPDKRNRMEEWPKELRIRQMPEVKQ